MGDGRSGDGKVGEWRKVGEGKRRSREEWKKGREGLGGEREEKTEW